MNQSRLIRIAVAEDHHMVREMLINAINQFDGFEVVASAPNGKVLIDQIERMSILPDICVLDIRMPELTGYETLAIIKRKWPGTKALALTMLDNEFAILLMLINGANGYLYKGGHLAELRNALISIYNKGYYHSNVVPEELFINAKELVVPKLTTREKEYLALCCSDMDNAAIANKMGISKRSLEHYHQTLSEKLNIQTRTGLVMFVQQTGII